MSGPLATGNLLLYRGGHGTGEFGLAVSQGVIPGGSGVMDVCFEVSQVVQRADDPMADLLKYRWDLGVGGRFCLEKGRLATLVSTREKDALDHDDMHVEIEEKLSITPCRPA